ncbi:serine/threonine-protein kinase [Actinomadura napierensis]|uniref:non-specific serine/threonine protein kinase n=1 Tax=Actinomadura napierensis TaxID=267854 RepID=A0ABN2Y5Q7_9ACTN
MPQTIHEGRYELLEELGRGGMGVVWRARDTVLHREVALKEVSPPRGLDEAQAERMYARTMREARSAAGLDHHGIVTVYDVVREDGRPWIVMQLVRAPALDEVIRREGPLAPDRVARIGLDLLEALRAAHGAGVVHRDVKPGNVLLTDRRAVLTDFGIATIVGDETLTQTGAIVGSPAYLSPEQARREDATPASDLWSLGATLYAAVEGRRPYERPDIFGLMGALLRDDPDPPRRAGPLEPVLHGLLRRDARTRIGHDEAERLLRLVVPGAPLPASPPVPGPQPPPEPIGLNTTLGGGGQDTLPPAPVPGPGPSPQPSGPHPPGPRPPEPQPQPPRRRRWELIVPAGVFAAAVVAAAVAFAVFVDNGGNGGPTNGSTPSASGSAGTGAASTGIPSGYHRYQGSAFVAAVRDGWKADGSGDDVTFSDPAKGATRGVAVSRVQPGLLDTRDPGDALASAAEGFDDKDSGYTDYKQVYFRRNVPYRDRDAAEIDFTFVKNGRPSQARVRVFAFDGALYQVLAAADQAHWDATLPVYDTFLNTFQAPG